MCNETSTPASSAAPTQEYRLLVVITTLKLADKVLSPGERTQFDAAPDKHRAFLTFWVLKEASVKLSGEGLKGYPNHTNFSLDDPRVTEMDGCLVAVFEEGE